MRFTSYRAQTINESPIARAVVPRTSFGGVESTSKAVYLSNSNLLCPDSALTVRCCCCCCCCCCLLLIHTFSVLSLQLKKLRRYNKSAIDILNANPACGHKEVQRSTGHIMVTTACRHPPEGHQIGARKRRAPGNTILSQPYRRRVSTDRLNRESSQLAASLEGEPGPTPAGKTLPHSYPETRFRRERARDNVLL